MPIEPTAIVTRSAAIVDSVLDDEVVALNTESGETLVFEGSGRAIWEQTAAPKSVAEICAAIEARYAVEPVRCLAEVSAFPEALTEKGMVALASD